MRLKLYEAPAGKEVSSCRARCGRRARIALNLGVAAVTVMAWSLPRQAIAGENGKSHYPLGVNTTASALVAPPVGQTVLLNYTQYYNSDDDVGSNGRSALPGYKLDVVVDSVRLLHSFAIWHGITFGTQVIPSFIVSDVNVHGIQHDRGGLGDLNLGGYAQYHIGDWYFAGYMCVFAPTGRYSPSDPDSQGLNYWSYVPFLAINWMPDHGKYEFGVTPVLSFNSTNPATHYHSGSLFDVDYNFGVSPFRSVPTLQLGIGGYINNQFTNDTKNGVPYLNGNRARVLAIGPQVLYRFGKYGVAVKWQHEFDVRNLPKGDRVWFEFKVPL